MISIKHSNRRLHNWLLYNIGDTFRKRYSIYYKKHIVDLGCGESPYKNYFLKFADKYTGVDWSNTIHNSGADVVSDLNIKINLEDNVADTIVSISVMEHLYDPQNFLFEASRILKTDGYFILQVPWQWHLHEEPHDFFRYTPHGLKHMLNKAGFIVHEVKPTTGLFTTQALKLNYFSLRLLPRNKFMKYLVALCLLPFWFVSQVIAPYLDKLDKNWNLETQGYYVLAQKD